MSSAASRDMPIPARRDRDQLRNALAESAAVDDEAARARGFLAPDQACLPLRLSLRGAGRDVGGEPRCDPLRLDRRALLEPGAAAGAGGALAHQDLPGGGCLLQARGRVDGLPGDREVAPSPLRPFPGPRGQLRTGDQNLSRLDHDRTPSAGSTARTRRPGHRRGRRAVGIVRARGARRRRRARRRRCTSRSSRRAPRARRVRRRRTGSASRAAPRGRDRPRVRWTRPDRRKPSSRTCAPPRPDISPIGRTTTSPRPLARVSRPGRARVWRRSRSRTRSSSSTATR